jgi:hypothetical protein
VILESGEHAYTETGVVTEHQRSQNVDDQGQGPPNRGIGHEEITLPHRWSIGPHRWSIGGIDVYDGSGSHDFHRHAQLLPSAGSSGSRFCISIPGE